MPFVCVELEGEEGCCCWSYWFRVFSNLWKLFKNCPTIDKRSNGSSTWHMERKEVLVVPPVATQGAQNDKWFVLQAIKKPKRNQQNQVINWVIVAFFPFKSPARITKTTIATTTKIQWISNDDHFIVDFMVL